MKKRIITISREFGSGGRYIGRELADRLGIAFYDKEIIRKTAEASGMAEEFVEKKGEHSPSKNLFSYGLVGRDASGASLDDYLFSVQRRIILGFAEEGPCVIVGRCADYILREREDCLNAFIFGNQEEKAARIMRIYLKTREEALKLMKDVDKKRSTHYRYYTDQTWGNMKNYTMTLNSSELGYETCIRMLLEASQNS